MRKHDEPIPIALIMPLADIHARRLIRGIGRFARPFKAWDFQLESPDGSALQSLRRNKPAGVIAMLTDPKLERRIAGLGVPLVNCSSELDDPSCARVVLDNPAIGKYAAKYFLDRGFRSLAYCGDPTSRVSRDRGEGFTRAALEAGAEVSRWDETTNRAGDHADTAVGWLGSGDRRSLRIWLQRLPKPVGILSAHDAVGVRVSECCRRIGLRVPTEVSLLGVDNDPVLCGLAYPALSSIQTPQEQVGFEAARRLDVLMRGYRIEPSVVKLGDARVVARQSTTLSRHVDVQVDAALRFISEHADQPLRVDDVVDHVGGSRRSLELRFREAVGRSILDAIQQAHVALACRLLAETDATVEEVAEASGFNSRERFSVVFRRLVGRSPRAAYPRGGQPGFVDDPQSV